MKTINSRWRSQKRAVRPIYNGVTDKGVTPFDFFVFTRSTCPLERSGAAHRVLSVLPRQIGFVAIKIGDDTYTSRFALFGVEIRVLPRGAFNASVVK